MIIDMRGFPKATAAARVLGRPRAKDVRLVNAYTSGTWKSWVTSCLGIRNESQTLAQLSPGLCFRVGAHRVADHCAEFVAVELGQSGTYTGGAAEDQQQEQSGWALRGHSTWS